MRFLEIAILTLGAGVSFQGAGSGAPAQPACRKSPEGLSVGSSAAGLAGEYKLVIVGTEGVAASRSVTGTLRLWSPPESLQTVRRLDGAPNVSLKIPLIGAADIDLTNVGGVDDGDLTSTDPFAPGIAVRELNAVYQGKPFTEITLHVGSSSNRRNVMRFDGPYNALYVDRIDSTSFSGRWHASLGYTTYKAEGYFCAMRR
jgi:hypothetical protein